MDPQMNPEMDPVRLIFGDPCQKKALKGPFKAHIDIFSRSILIIFALNQNRANTRNHEKNFVQPARTERLAWSAIPYMQRLLNEN